MKLRENSILKQADSFRNTKTRPVNLKTHPMKKISFKLILLLLCLSSFSSLFSMWGGGPRKTSLFLAGAELKMRPLNISPKQDPTTRDTVEIRLIFY